MPPPVNSLKRSAGTLANSEITLQLRVPWRRLRFSIVLVTAVVWSAALLASFGSFGAGLVVVGLHRYRKLVRERWVMAEPETVDLTPNALQ